MSDSDYSGYSDAAYEEVQKQTLSLGDSETYPKKGDVVMVHYEARIAREEDEKPFDSSLQRGPFKFKLGEGNVIRGWEIGMKKISLGERAMLKIPAEYAYGATGVDGVIPPFTDLDFEVHLMAINGRYNKDATAPARCCSIM